MVQFFERDGSPRLGTGEMPVPNKEHEQRGRRSPDASPRVEATAVTLKELVKRTETLQEYCRSEGGAVVGRKRQGGRMEGKKGRKTHMIMNARQAIPGMSRQHSPNATW